MINWQRWPKRGARSVERVAWSWCFLRLVIDSDDFSSDRDFLLLSGIQVGLTYFFRHFSLRMGSDDFTSPQFNYQAMVIFFMDLLLLRQGCRSSQLKKPTGLFLNAVHSHGGPRFSRFKCTLCIWSLYFSCRMTARSRRGGKNNRQVILAKEPRANRAARCILFKKLKYKRQWLILLAPVFYFAAHAEVRGSLASKVHWTFDPYIFP